MVGIILLKTALGQVGTLLMPGKVKKKPLRNYRYICHPQRGSHMVADT